MGDRQKMTVKVSQENETSWTKDQTGIRVRINCAYRFLKKLIEKTMNFWEVPLGQSEAKPILA